MSNVQGIDAATARRWLDAGEAILLDVREPDEHAAERIAGATLNPLSKFDPAFIPSAPGKKLIVHCRSGKRSSDACTRLAGAGRANVFSLEGGLEAWKAAPLPIQKSASAPAISIMRQVQLVAGSIVVTAAVLAWLVSPWFILLSGFIGAGLMFSGATGTCGMAAVLSRMPWNRYENPV